MPDSAGARDALESNKTAVVWLVVVNVLTVLATLAPLPLKWAAVVYTALVLGSVALAYLAYSRAGRAERLIANAGAASDAEPPATSAEPPPTNAEPSATDKSATDKSATNEAVMSEVATSEVAASEAATGRAAADEAAPS